MQTVTAGWVWSDDSFKEVADREIDYDESYSGESKIHLTGKVVPLTEL